MRCGRYIDHFGDSYQTKQANFDRSLKDLEEMVNTFMADLAQAQREADAAQRLEELPPGLAEPPVGQ
ncbi:MAG: hypothetical protein ACT4OM_13680 [Actinomycetota bacterium]